MALACPLKSCTYGFSRSRFPLPRQTFIPRPQTLTLSRPLNTQSKSLQNGNETTAGRNGASETKTGLSKGKNRKSRDKPQTSSLRRVAVEAERSRGTFPEKSYRTNAAENDSEARDVTAYCAAEQYDIKQVAYLLESRGYILDPCETKLYPQVVHVQIHPSLEIPFQKAQKNGLANGIIASDIFVFPSGALVAWDVEPSVAHSVIAGTLLPAATAPYSATAIESEDLEFEEYPGSEKSSVVGETIRLGTKPLAPDSDILTSTQESGDESDTTSGHEAERTTEQQQQAAYLTLTKIAFSSGLARSSKLSVLETSLSNYFSSTRDIPILLSKGTRLPYSRDFVLRKLGELLSIRAQLNLYSELTDSLPDLFWDSRHELGLEGCFEQVGRALDVGIRIKTLNEKVGYAQEIATVLRERLSERHGLLLEWMIILLITVEVVFEMRRVWTERAERESQEELDELLRRYLRQQLNEQS